MKNCVPALNNWHCLDTRMPTQLQTYAEEDVWLVLPCTQCLSADTSRKPLSFSLFISVCAMYLLDLRGQPQVSIFRNPIHLILWNQILHWPWAHWITKRQRDGVTIQGKVFIFLMGLTSTVPLTGMPIISDSYVQSRAKSPAVSAFKSQCVETLQRSHLKVGGQLALQGLSDHMISECKPQDL